jgi:hypothetical protein
VALCDDLAVPPVTKRGVRWGLVQNQLSALFADLPAANPFGYASGTR